MVLTKQLCRPLKVYWDSSIFFASVLHRCLCVIYIIPWMDGLLSAPVWLMQEFSHITRGTCSLFPSISLRLFWHLSRDWTAVAAFGNVSLGSKVKRRTDMYSCCFVTWEISTACALNMHNYSILSWCLAYCGSDYTGAQRLVRLVKPLCPFRTSTMVRCHITKSSWKNMMSQIVLHEDEITACVLLISFVTRQTMFWKFCLVTIRLGLTFLCLLLYFAISVFLRC